MNDDWRSKANCRPGLPHTNSGTHDLFFPGKNQTTPARKAKKICEECEVIKECEFFAIWSVETHGIWGGTSPRERRPLRKIFVKNGGVLRDNDRDIAVGLRASLSKKKFLINNEQ